MGQTPTQQTSPAEVIASMNLGYNAYTDPTLTNPRQWVSASNVFSGAFGFVQRCRFANVVVATTPGYTPQTAPFLSLKFAALPGLGNYLLGDVGGTMWSFDTLGYPGVARPLLHSQVPGISYVGPWSREFLQNTIYEMNGIVKQSGRNANFLTVDEWGIDAPDTSPQVTINAGATAAVVTIQRSDGTVIVTLGAPLTVPGGDGIGMINVSGVTDTSFNGTFVCLTGSGTTILTWTQAGQNTGLIATGNVDVSITKSVGRSYAWAWENANDFHISAPSPSTQFIQYTVQNGVIDLIEQGTITVAGTNVIGIGTSFSPAWVGKFVWIDGTGGLGIQVIAVNSATSMTLALPSGGSGAFTVYDPQSTNVRLYSTADGGSTYFRVQRNTFNPFATTLLAAGLRFFDNAQAEPPNFPFTTETSQLFNVPPPIGRFVKEYQGRLIVYGVPGLGQTFFYSNNELTNFGLPQESFAPLNQVTLPIQNADINGMAEFPGSLIIWSDKQDMFRLTGLLSDNSTATATQQGAQIAALPYNLGCASPFSVALTPLGAIWLSSNAEVWLYTDRYAPRNIGRPVQDILSNIPTALLSKARGAYYHTQNRNWYVLAVPNGTNNNVLLVLDLDLLAANGSPSYFVFDMATNQPAWFRFDIPCTWAEPVYETGGAVRLMVTGTNDVIEDTDYMTGLFGTELPVPNAGLTTHAWGNDSAFMLKRPSWFRFQTNREPQLLALDGWSFQTQGIDDDVYTFAFPLRLNHTPGVNDASTLGGNPNLFKGEPFRHSPELYRVGGVNFVMGRRFRFVINFPSATGINYQFRSIQIGFGATPPR